MSALPTLYISCQRRLLRYPTLRSLGAWRNRRPRRLRLQLAVSPTGCARNLTPKLFTIHYSLFTRKPLPCTASCFHIYLSPYHILQGRMPTSSRQDFANPNGRMWASAPTSQNFQVVVLLSIICENLCCFRLLFCKNMVYIL